MQTFDAIRRRHSVRQFSEKAVKKEDLIRLVDCARFAATARNEQPWEFIVVTDRDKRERLALIVGENGPFIKDAPACIIIVCRDTKYYLEDGCAACQNLLVAASDLGLGSCWVAGDKKAYAQEVKSLLGAPESYKLISLVAVGYAGREKIKNINKRAAEEILHWQQF